MDYNNLIDAVVREAELYTDDRSLHDRRDLCEAEKRLTNYISGVVAERDKLHRSCMDIARERDKAEQDRAYWRERAMMLLDALEDLLAYTGRDGRIRLGEEMLRDVQEVIAHAREDGL